MRLICDAMLGRLARYLRLLGIDAVCPPSAASEVSDGEETFFITRGRSGTRHARTIRVTSDKAVEQLREIRAFIGPFVDDRQTLARCIECNVGLTTIERKDVEAFVPEYVFHHYSSFTTCPSCKRVYWEGSHVKNIRRILQEALT